MSLFSEVEGKFMVRGAVGGRTETLKDSSYVSPQFSVPSYIFCSSSRVMRCSSGITRVVHVNKIRPSSRLCNVSKLRKRWRSEALPDNVQKTAVQDGRQDIDIDIDNDVQRKVEESGNGAVVSKEGGKSELVQIREGNESTEGLSMATGSRLRQAVSSSLPPEGFILFVACIVGLVTGGAVVLFNTLVHEIHDILWEGVPGVEWLRAQPLEDTWQRLILVPVSGGILVGALNGLRSSIETNSETPNISRGGGKGSFISKLKAVTSPTLKALAAAVTLGTGNSLGPEGPSVEVGASVATGMSKLLKNSRERTQAMVAAGSAAGISSGFNAAVAGCFFAVESVLRKTGGEAGSLTTAMILLSSVLASVVSQAGLGSDPAFKVPAYEFRSPAELPLYLLLGVLCGLVSIALSRSSIAASQGFDRLQKGASIPAFLLPPLGSLCVGTLALAYPEILYWGFENIDFLLESRPFAHPPPPLLLLQLVGVKIIATAVSRGSGLVGGVYAPSLFIGAALGSAYGRLAASALAWAEPTYHVSWISLASPQAYALVGMAATLAGVCQVPLTSVLLLFELTRDYRIILPLMAAVGLSAWIASTDIKKQRKLSSTSSVQSRLPVPVSVPMSGQASMPQISSSGETSSEQLQSEIPVVNGTSADSSRGSSEEANRAVQTGQSFVDNSVNEDVEMLCLLEDSLCLVDGALLEDQLMEEIPVHVAMRSSFAAVSEMATVRDAMAEMAGKKEWCCLVLGKDNSLHGLLTLVDVQQEAQRMAGSFQGNVQLLPVMAVCRARVDKKTNVTQIVTVGQEETLSGAQRLMTPRGLRQLPVIGPSLGSEGRHVVGVLDRDGINLACRAEATQRLLALGFSTPSDPLLTSEKSSAVY